MYYWSQFIQDINSSIQPGQTLLDAGAGNCHWKNYLPSTVKYIGIDLGIGDSDYDYSKLDIRCDLRDIPLADNSIDIIICIQVLEHLPEPCKVIAEFNRVLKPSGFLFISCPQAEPQHQIPYDFFRYTPFGLRSLLKSNNFDIVWIKPQLGNFHRLGEDLSYSARKLVTLSNQKIENFLYLTISYYLRLMWKIHKPMLLYFDKFESLQDNCTGHFLKAVKL